MVVTFAALAEPNRFRIVELLRRGGRSVNEIGADLALAQPQVSKHLKVLKTAGIVDVEPRAQQRVYALRGESLRDLSSWLDGYRALWDERFAQLDDVLDEMQADVHAQVVESQAENASVSDNKPNPARGTRGKRRRR